jgi:hypothetical protein
MTNKTRREVDSEKIRLSSLMLFPPQILSDEHTIVKRLESATDRSKKENLLVRTRELQERNERDRWAYITDLQIERLAKQIEALNTPKGDFPNDNAQAESQSEIELQPREIDSDIGAPIIMMPEDLLRFLERAPAVVRNDAMRRSVDGQAAGSILRYVYHLCVLKEESSLTKGIELFQKFYHSNYGRGRPKEGEERYGRSFSSSKIKNIWKEYRSVAHLWAAFLVSNDDVIIPDNEPLKSVDFARFLSTATFFEEFGTNFNSKNTKKEHRLLNSEHLATNQGHWRLTEPTTHINMVSEKIMRQILVQNR